MSLSRSHPVFVTPDRVDFSVVSSPSHWLSSVPRREGIGGETRMNKGEMGGVERMVQIMVVVVDLDRGELTFVDDVGWSEGTDIEGFGKATAIIIKGNDK